MMKNRLFLDIAAGGGLAFVLLFIFLIDRIASSSVPLQDSSNARIDRKPGTLLGDDAIVVRMKALGSEERLEKLKVVRLTAKATFAEAINVNDITLMWCWEPRITMRFVEMNPFEMRRFQDLFEINRDIAEKQLLILMKERLALDGDLEREFEREARTLFARRDYRPFFDSVLILEDKQAFDVFNELLPIPLNNVRAAQMRNLCFALSLSNLVPIRRHKFQVEPADQEMIRGRWCDQFMVRDRDGLKLQLFFDRETQLLAKIAHMGHNPSHHAVSGQVYWEHYFSEYRETDGIKQWRKAEVDNDGKRFATLDVTGVEFFDEMRPEMRLPGR